MIMDARLPRSLSAFLCAMVALSVAAHRADASCNALPDPPSLFAKSALGQQVKSQVPADLRYRGAIGRIDRVVIVPRPDARIVIGPDLACNERALAPVADAPAGPDHLIGLALFDADIGRPQLAVYATPEVRTRIERILSRMASPEHRWLSPRNVHWQTDRLEVEHLSTPDGPSFRVRLGYPRTDAGMLSGSINLALVGATQTGINGLTALGNTLAADGCLGALAGFVDDRDGYVCIDQIYDDYTPALNATGSGPPPPTRRCRPQFFIPSIVPCNLIGVKAPDNDFAHQCLSDPYAADPSLPDCQKSPKTLSFHVDTCSNIFIPFKWTGVLAPEPPNGKRPKREVRGYSGTSRRSFKKNGEGERIRIPGREFLGSLHTYAPSTSGDWRKPEIEVYPLGPDSEAVGLKGTVDKDYSTVEIHPRLAVSHLCTFTDSFVGNTWTEACLAVEQMQNGGTEKCACSDRIGTICVCDQNSPARMWACNGGEFHGMPCTRPSHCGLSGTCNRPATCRVKGTVWSETTSLINQSTKACYTDVDCIGAKDGKGNAARQCGLALFEFRKRAQKNKGVVELEFPLSFNWKSGKQRGTCLEDVDDVCHKSPGILDCLWVGGCRGYALEALGAR